MKHFFKSSLIIILSFFCGLFFYTESIFAASFSLSSSTKQVSPGATFTISVGGDCIGRVNLRVSNGTLSSSAVWVEENYQTITVTAGSSGTVTVTATPETGFSDSDANEYNPGSRTTSVSIIAPTPTPPSKPSTPTPPASNNSTKPSQKPSNQQPSTPDNSNDNTSTTVSPEDMPTTDNSSADEPTDTTDETTSEDSEPKEDNTCNEKSNNSLIAWIIAAIFAILFICTLGILIYVLNKHHKTQDPKKENPPSSKKTKTKKVQIS